MCSFLFGFAATTKAKRYNPMFLRNARTAPTATTLSADRSWGRDVATINLRSYHHPCWSCKRSGGRRRSSVWPATDRSTLSAAELHIAERGVSVRRAQGVRQASRSSFFFLQARVWREEDDAPSLCANRGPTGGNFGPAPSTAQK